MIELQIKKELHGAEGEMELDLSLKIQKGEFIALSGKSGSGKTTLLRILAGLEDAKGEIRVEERIWLDNTTTLAPQKREIGFVFQDYALFENMTIEENLLFVAKDHDLAKHLLALTELYKLKDHYPQRLSGGQQQRVSICRALMKRPKLLLLDEPLSALDPQMRKKLQSELLSLHKEFQTTTIMVSHDPSEIYRLASRVIELNNGKVKNDGTPKDILLKTEGSQKFSFEGELLAIKELDVVFVAVVAIGQQLVEVVLSQEEIKGLEIGQKITLSTKAFSPTLSSI